jgi:carbohydrate-binding DOMON domain-containing protein
MKKWSILGLVVAGLCMTAGMASAEELSFKDPKGDDNGHGKITYPSHKVYVKGSFDLREVKIEESGDKVEVTVEFDATIEDPWDSKSWSGNGFSLQFAQIYLDTDHKAGSGHENALPGMNVSFKDDARWEKVLLVSPQPNNRLKSEVDAKAASVGKDVVYPKKVQVQGKKLKATFDKKDVGAVSGAWGVQVLVQSNEGYPTKEDLLTRKVNEYEGEHRFGGGNDHDCDAHVIDMLAGAAGGGDDEKKAQNAELAGFTCQADGKGTLAKVGMIYKK